jgi:hypothetical protein
MAETLTQINVALPTHLVEFIRREAARQDHTLSGAIRHLISEAARREPPVETGMSDAFAPPVPPFPATVEGIAAAKDRVAKLRQEEETLRRRRARWQTTADEDRKVDRLVAEIEIMNKRIASAEKMLPRSRNGG